MTWSVLNIDYIDYIDMPSEALNTEIQISSTVVDYLNCSTPGGLLKCPISVMYKNSLHIQVFFPPELSTIALLFGAKPIKKPDFETLKGMSSIEISPIGLDVNSPYFQSLFVKSNHS
ncbi:hypothetical protein C0W42_11600 [Photobacterium kishitanii]|uniref:hypothetical protein n=1 Tax=Photobacterium kishitanii TaxID=318456 RepID=UPI000D177E11|nr:hypothetical protein [Photobacterium kishitanii]PSU88971.1 hypothetical protein C0W42_11600 [Photobacterium kishitanii]